ncbi:ROK family transcriptional regulator [Streptomyces ureilyticus]|uniref:ROK family transcriptional regulator n=1 Tax=Streptomyces ureilyticus TaxID=1775131 RepID=UPI002E28D6F7|nr:ROK family transcriptional regulator [Streptomyces ureilyticus]
MVTISRPSPIEHRTTSLKRTYQDIRRTNRFAVMRYLIASAPVVRRDIAATTGLSVATASDIVNELHELGLLAEIGQQASGGGRPRNLLAPALEGPRLIGVDIAETYVHVEVFDPALRVLARAEYELHPHANSPDYVVDRIVRGIDDAIAQAKVERARILGVGVSIPGQVRPDGTASVFAPNWQWNDVPLLALLTDRVPDLPVILDNPLRASTVAELWFGAARGHDNVAVLTLGTGVGAGLAVQGALYRGATNTAGEWGHTNLVIDGRKCRRGCVGCVETYVGAPGIMQHLAEADPDSPLLHPDDQMATIDALATAHAAGDPAAQQAIATTGRYLGIAIANLINLFNPQTIVLTGWVADSLGSAVLPYVRATAARYALAEPWEGTEISLCPIDRNPVSLGAATLVLEGFLS